MHCALTVRGPLGPGLLWSLLAAHPRLPRGGRGAFAGGVEAFVSRPSNRRARGEVSGDRAEPRANLYDEVTARIVS